ncbi:MAG: hypothetical protein LBW85_07215 [Deltaproteobacteria bacterium]|nr:hypothetical protein [Deltaproteobacteria bacterium]
MRANPNANEAEVTSRVVEPTVKELGWKTLLQRRLTVSAVHWRPDALLFPSTESHDQFNNLAEPDYRLAGAVLEIKNAAQALDTGKAGSANPYNQLLTYLQAFRIGYGILTNGADWLLVDNTRVTSSRRFVSFSLLRIAESLADAAAAKDAADALGKFWRLFDARTYADKEDKGKLIDSVSRRAAERRRRLEDDLKSVIYGENGRYSLFENIGRAIYEFTESNGIIVNLESVFENSLYLLFRLVFLSYFEDRYKEALSIHPGYARISLARTAEFMTQFDPQQWRGRHVLWESLKHTFNTLNNGSELTGVPTLDGGLFSPDKAPILEEDALIRDRDLFVILSGLLYDKEEGMRRDFRSLSPSHLGAIYQGLTEYEFRIADEDLSYLKITYSGKNKGEPVRDEGFFDSYDMAQLKKLKAESKEVTSVKKGELYLQSSSRNRKISGTYYTPDGISGRLARMAIERLLETAFRDPARSLLDVRILDSSCGSGHLLIDALNVLAAKALERVDLDLRLKATLESEVTSIKAVHHEIFDNGDTAEENLNLDERDVLKRILLKKTIYGVDLSRFAVELTKLSLWLDTFIFGTPLSFIEHHVKHGNALVGTDLDCASSIFKTGKVHTWKYRQSLKDLQAGISEINALNDSNGAQIQRSKNRYAAAGESIREINRLLDVKNCRDILENCLGMKPFTPEFGRFADGMKTIGDFDSRLAFTPDFTIDTDKFYAENGRLMDRFRKEFGFFNWESEFPEAFGADDPGFHVIIGNPPWDKTHFEDPLFFSRYRRSYRSLPESEKRAVRSDILDKPEAKTLYDAEKSRSAVLNAYLRRKYPYNSGIADGNMYRFFVERNLGLLAAGGCLNYVIPSALLTDDGSKLLRKHIIENFRIISFNGFHNGKSIFPDVHAREKFGLIQMEKTVEPRQAAAVRFMMTEPEALDSAEGVFPYPCEDLIRLSPDYLAYLEIVDGPRQFPLLKRIYSSHEPLNGDWLDFSQDLNATKDKALFREKPEAGLIGLYEGKMIWQFDCRHAGPRLWLDPEELDRHQSEKCLKRILSDVGRQFAFSVDMTSDPMMADPADLSLSRLKTSELSGFLRRECRSESLAGFFRPNHGFMRLCFRDVAANVNERTVVAAVLPAGTAMQHTLWASIPGKYRFDREKREIAHDEIPPERLFFALGIMNSVAFDWTARFSASTHVGKSVLFRIPFPQPDDTEISEPGPFRDLARHAALLTLRNAPDLFPGLAARFGITGHETAMTDKRYDTVMARASVIAAGIYGLSACDMEIMLDSFKVLKNKRPGFRAELLKQAREHLPS